MTTLAIEHIVSDPAKHGGKPRIAGKGITVQHIAALYNHGWTIADFVEEYELTPGQVHAALSYYFDHQDEIDSAIRESAAHVDELTDQGAITPFDDLKRRIESRNTSR